MNDKQSEQVIAELKEIKRALMGSPDWNEKGLIKEVADLKKWQGQITLKLAALSGGATVVVLCLNKASEVLMTILHK